MKSGIYAVANFGNCKIYVGETHKLQKRWKAMIEQFMQGKFPNANIQQAWEEGGKDRKFSFHTAKEITEDTQILGRNQFVRDMNQELPKDS